MDCIQTSNQKETAVSSPFERKGEMTEGVRSLDDSSMIIPGRQTLRCWSVSLVLLLGHRGLPGVDYVFQRHLFLRGV